MTSELFTWFSNNDLCREFVTQSFKAFRMVWRVEETRETAWPSLAALIRATGGEVDIVHQLRSRGDFIGRPLIETLNEKPRLFFLGFYFVRADKKIKALGHLFSYPKSGAGFATSISISRRDIWIMLRSGLGPAPAPLG